MAAAHKLAWINEWAAAGSSLAALAGWLAHTAVTWLVGWLVGSRLGMFQKKISVNRFSINRTETDKMA